MRTSLFIIHSCSFIIAGWLAGCCTYICKRICRGFPPSLAYIFTILLFSLFITTFRSLNLYVCYPRSDVIYACLTWYHISSDSAR